MSDYPTEPLFPRTIFRELARPLQHPEALCWDPLTQRVYCGGEGGQIFAVTLEGTISQVANTGGSVLGMAVDGRGRVYACDWHRREVVRVDPFTGSVETYTTGCPRPRDRRSQLTCIRRGRHDVRHRCGEPGDLPRPP